MKTKVTIEEILAIRKRRKEINDLDIREIEFTLDGVVINVTDQDLEEWRFMGLNNFDFVAYFLEGNYIPVQEE